MRHILSDGLSELQISFTKREIEQFCTYYAMLTEKNTVMNLTAIKGEEDTARLHFLDCAALLKSCEFAGKSVVDIGTGAGFPGIPLKILQPDLSLTLLDSHGKRMGFVSDVCNALDFADTRCVCARAEDVCSDIGGSFDIAVSRAVARLNILCELCLPFVHVGGVFIAMKGPDCADELREAQHAIRVLGGGTPELKTYRIPGTDITHSAVLIPKLSPSPELYPRPFAKIKKAPL
ncbi:MAG: 16S rRNA (guanine(527)-N(7))-methyltransferase RsmG [Oscillospiraceae bacterium]|jgi:16S rRNA (guanine527-N7)-methyltransferase